MARLRLIMPLFLASLSLSVVVDKCVLEPSNTAAIEVLTGYQSQLINQFALEPDTKVEVLMSTEKVPTKNQKIIYKISPAVNSPFYIGVEFQTVDGKTEIEDFYQSKNLAKVGAFFNLEISETPISCPNFQLEFAKFSNDYLKSVSASLAPKPVGSTSVSVSGGSGSATDGNAGANNFKFVPTTQVTAELVKGVTGVGTAGTQKITEQVSKPQSTGYGSSNSKVEIIQGEGVTKQTTEDASAAGSGTSSSSTSTVSTTSSTSATVSASSTASNGAGASVSGSIPASSKEKTLDNKSGWGSSKVGTVQYVVSQNIAGMVPIVLDESDKILVDYVGNNFKLAYGLTIFKRNSLQIKAATDATAFATPTGQVQENRKRRLRKNSSEQEARTLQIIRGYAQNLANFNH